MGWCISDLLLRANKQPHPYCLFSLSVRDGAEEGPAHTEVKDRFTSLSRVQTAACQKTARQGEMKDGNMGEMGKVTLL